MSRGDMLKKLYNVAAKKYFPQEEAKAARATSELGLMRVHGSGDSFLGMNADGHARVWMGRAGTEVSFSPSTVVKEIRHSLETGGEISTPMMKSLEELTKLPRNKPTGMTHD